MASRPAVPQDAFPDLHHKMSKKIAQLTKVIFYLNSKNELHQSEVSFSSIFVLEDSNSTEPSKVLGIQDAYESEIDEILRDAHKRLLEFHTRLEGSINEQNLLVDSLRRQHAAELTAVQQKYQEEKRVFCLRSSLSFKKIPFQLLSSESQLRVSGLTVEIENLKAQFAERAQQLLKGKVNEKVTFSVQFRFKWLTSMIRTWSPNSMS